MLNPPIKIELKINCSQFVNALQKTRMDTMKFQDELTGELAFQKHKPGYFKFIELLQLILVVFLVLSNVLFIWVSWSFVWRVWAWTALAIFVVGIIYARLRKLWINRWRENFGWLNRM